MEKYISFLELNNYSKNTIYAYRYVLKKFLKYINNNLNNINYVSNYFKFIINQKNSSAATINFHKVVIINYFKFVKNNLYKKIENIKIPKINNKFYKTISIKDFNKVIKSIYIREHTDLFKFLFFTGIRLSELKSIQINSINKSIKIYGKGMKFREIPIISKIKDINFLQISKYSKKQIYQIIKLYWDSWVTPHTFRRSFCTNLIKKGANIKVVSLIMGHAKIETTSKYIHYNKLDIIKELENHL